MCPVHGKGGRRDSVRHQLQQHDARQERWQKLGRTRAASAADNSNEQAKEQTQGGLQDHASDAAPDEMAPEGSVPAEMMGGDLLEQHIRALRRYAYALVGGAPIADDLVQETLARAILYLRQNRARSGEQREIRNLRSYLLTILHNVRVDHIKSDRRQGELLPLEEQQLATPATQIGRLECNEVATAINDLPEEQREVLLLIGLEGLSYQEATEILDVPLGTVMSRLNRGRNAVKARLGRADVSRPAAQSQAFAKLQQFPAKGPPAIENS